MLQFQAVIFKHTNTASKSTYNVSTANHDYINLCEQGYKALMLKLNLDLDKCLFKHVKSASKMQSFNDGIIIDMMGIH